MFDNSVEPGPFAVYAVDSYALDYDGRAPYVMERLAPPQTSFRLSVPPGEYVVVARLDSNPLRGALHSYDFVCPTGPSPCVPRTGNSGIARVRVESKQAVNNVTVSEWGAEDAVRELWQIDVHGAPLTLERATPRPLPTRTLPRPSSDLTQRSDQAWAGFSLRLPSSWQQVQWRYGDSDRYFANEAVKNPLQLDANGVLLTARWYPDQCPSVDWRYPTAKTVVRMQGADVDFYFENPSGAVGRQPFSGYVLRGSRPVFATCIAFIFTGASQDALESNLPEIAGILAHAEFYKPTT